MGKNFNFILSTFPKVAVSLLYIWPGYIACFYMPQFFSTVWGTINTVVVLVLWGLGLFTYYRVVVFSSSSPKNFPELRFSNLADVETGLIAPPLWLQEQSVTLKQNGKFRYCRECHVWKPDRCHHCSSCNECVLRMDHHCPWFAACVGYRNHRFFIQFLAYSTLFSLYCFFIGMSYVYWFFKFEIYLEQVIDIKALVLTVLGFSFGIALLIFTSYSISLVLKNQTTNEMLRFVNYRDELRVFNEVTGRSKKEMDNPFDLGSKKANWCAVMGDSWIQWILPLIYIPGKGLSFPVNRNILVNAQNDDDLQTRLKARVSGEHVRLV